MIVLVPLLSGKEDIDYFVDNVCKGADKVILLQIIDREFMNKTSAAMGEVMQFSTLLSEMKKKIGKKRKPCEEITEWGTTTKKILSISIIQNVDKVFFLKQKNKFFDEIIKELKKNKIKYEIITVPGSENNE